MAPSKKPKPIHSASEFGLDVMSGDDDLFRWFLLCYLFGKPIQSGVAIKTWELFVEYGLDTPWAIQDAKGRTLVRILYEGKYTRYAESTARALRECMGQLINLYEGSLLLLIESSESEEECIRRLKTFYGVGPKVTEIFMREAGEYFARRNE